MHSVSSHGRAVEPRSTRFGDCLRDPIHTPGRIQGYGALVAADRSTGRITHASAPFEAVADRQPATLASLLGETAHGVLQGLDLNTDRPGMFRTWRAEVALPGYPAFTSAVIAHDHGRSRILEFLPDGDVGAPSPTQRTDQQTLIQEIQRSTGLDDAVATIARVFRQAAGYDRVMVYSFHEDGHGEVVAEACTGPTRFLRHRFPSSDIPPPARALYRRNKIRLIADVFDPTHAVTPMDPDGGGDGALDMSHAVLRATAPVHIQYLKTMGVAASLSVSLIVEEKLWGLIACHHDTMRRLAPADLQFCEILGDVAAGVLERRILDRRLRRLRRAQALSQQCRTRPSPTDPPGSLDAIFSEIVDLAGSDGLIGRIGSRIVSAGATPPLNALAPVLIDLPTDRVSVLPDLGLKSERNSLDLSWGGGAYLPLSPDGQDFLFLVRMVSFQERLWGGRPDHDTRLGPRKSFETWRETHGATTVRFEDDAEELFDVIRHSLSLCLGGDAPDTKRHGADPDRPSRPADRMAAVGDLASGLAHELNQPLASVINYAATCNLLLKQANDRARAGATDSKIGPLVQNMLEEARRASEIVRRLRRFMKTGTFEPEYIDLADTVRTAIQLALPPDQRQTVDLTFDTDRTLPSAWADPVQIQQVLFNLIRNALEAMAPLVRKSLDILVVRSADGMAEIRVRDIGPGVPASLIDRIFEAHVSSKPDGMGIGLSLSRSIVDAHGGTLSVRNVDPGAEFTIRLPLLEDDPEDDTPAPMGWSDEEG